jgi:hypothetical protein
MGIRSPTFQPTSRHAGAAVSLVIAGLSLAACASLEARPPGLPAKENHLLKACPAFTPADHPTRIYEIELPGIPFDPRNLQPVISQKYVTSMPWLSGDDQQQAPPPTPPNWNAKTPLDLDLKKPGVMPYGTSEKVLIKIKVDDPAVTFRQDGYAIAAGDHNGKQLFCQVPGGFTDHSATFMTYYFAANPGGPEIYSRFNVELTLPHPGGYIVPIILDPEVKNEG